MGFPSKLLTQLHGSNGPVHALTYSASPSTYILTGSSDRSIRLYNPSRPSANPQSNSSSINSSKSSLTTPPKPTQLIQTYSAHGYTVLSLTVSHDNATFASAGGDRSVFLWDVTTATTLRRFGGNQGHSSRINSVTFAGHEDSLLISGGYDASVRIWDVRAQNSAKPIMVLADAKDSISAVLAGRSNEIVAKGNWYEILSGSVDGRVRIYDVRMGRVEEDVVGAPVTSLSRTRDGKGVLVSTLDSTLRLMDRENGALLKSYSDASFTNTEFRLGSVMGGNERWVLSGNETPSFSTSAAQVDGEVTVWETVSGKIMERIRVPGVDASMTGRKRIVGGDGKEKQHRNVISCLAWKENGKGDQWCCAGTDGVVSVFGTP